MAHLWCTGMQLMLQQRFSEQIRGVLSYFNRINCNDIIFVMVYKNFVKLKHCF